MSKPVRLGSASSSSFRSLSTEERQLLVWAFALSIALHAVTMLLPAPAQKPTARELAVALTARIVAPEVAPEPPPAPVPQPEPAIQTRVEQPIKAEIKKASPSKPKARRPEKKAEPLAGQQLEDALMQLSDKLLYPPEAIRQGLQGETLLVLDVGEGGRIVMASVATSSGHPVLDQAALRAARQVGHLSPLLAGRSILLPVRFRLL
jgi:protein TonB